MILREDLERWFTYHLPDEDHPYSYERIRRAGWDFAEVICCYSPPSADQTAAIRKVREAVMTAHAAIACRGK